MEKFIYYGELFAIYKELLANNAQNIFSLYYEDNLTLQEIADNLNVSKSYIGNIIKKCEKKLDNLEDKLHIYDNIQKLTQALELEDIKKIKKVISSVI